MTSNPFGRLLTAMVAPMNSDGSLSLDGAKAVVDHLAAHGHDGVVVNGTTGESATLSSDESIELITTVVDHVKGQLKVTAGVGSNDTAHSVEMAKRAADAGADGLLVVSPYYNRPTQAGLIAHCHAIADATELPVMLYDIPVRTAIPFDIDTLITLAAHPRIRAVKDAKGELWNSTQVMAATDLLWFSGDDVVTLPHLAQGAVGTVSVVGHLAGDLYAAMLTCVDLGDYAGAREIHRRLIPLVNAIMHTSQGAITVKAALAELGIIESAAVRLPLVESPPEHLERIRKALAEVGLS